MSNSKSAKNILLKLSGSIAAFKAAALLSKLVQAGHNVEVVATAGALKFIGEATLEGLTGKPVHTDLYARGDAMSHIHLARWADLILLCPASANTIAKLSHGLGDDLLSTLFLAHDFEKPYLIAPAMNTAMYKHPATQASLTRLREWGCTVLDASAGSLACGEIGEGRLLEPDELFAIVQKTLATSNASLATPPVTSKKSASINRTAQRVPVLITAGGTREPVDGVRSITNFSTGATGAALADSLSERGWPVTLITAESAVRPHNPDIEIKTYVTYADLSSLLEGTLKSTNYTAVLQAAAVADYSVDFIQSGDTRYAAGAVDKFDSRDGFSIQMKSNPRLIDSLRRWSRNPHIQIVGFKLTNSDSESTRLLAVATLAKRAQPDLIVHNDLHDIESGRHRATLYSVQNEKLITHAAVNTKIELAKELHEWLLAHAEAEGMADVSLNTAIDRTSSAFIASGTAPTQGATP